MTGDVAQSKCLEQQDVKVTPEKSKFDGIPLRKALIIELCAASAQLSSACAKVGFTALAVDFSGNSGKFLPVETNLYLHAQREAKSLKTNWFYFFAVQTKHVFCGSRAY